MHKIRTAWLVAVIIYLYLLYRMFSFVDVIKLQFIFVGSQFSNLYREIARHILIVCQHDTFHTYIYRFLSTIADNSRLLVEMSKHPCIVCHPYLEAFSHTNHGLRIFYYCTVTIWIYLFDFQSSYAFVSELEDSSNGLLESCLTHIYCSFLGNQFLCHSPDG